MSVRGIRRQSCSPAWSWAPLSVRSCWNRSAVLSPASPGSDTPVVRGPALERFLGGLLYGGITEELLMGLFLLSLVAWFFGRWWKTAAGMPTPGAFRAAILVVAVIFGLGHLPATAALAPLTQTLVMRALVLNGVAGVALAICTGGAAWGGDARTHERPPGAAGPGGDVAQDHVLQLQTLCACMRSQHHVTLLGKTRAATVVASRSG